MRDYYDVLSVSRGTSGEDLTAAYREKAKELHPDVNSHPEADEQFRRLKAAYEVLGSPKERRRYDRLGHRAYVEKYGGPTLEERKRTTTNEATASETGASGNRTGSSTDSPPGAERRSRADETAEPGGSATDSRTGPDATSESSTTNGVAALRAYIGRTVREQTGDFRWLVQGRTADSTGLVAYALRLLVFGLLAAVVVKTVELSTGNPDVAFGDPVAFTVCLLVARGVYLVGFESLRDEHVRIDDATTPDAYVLPYALLAGVVGGLLFFSSSAVRQFGGESAVPVFVWVVLLLVGAVLLFYGYAATILGVGWGAADDYYNYGYGPSPVVWNFAVQSPLLLFVGGVVSDVTRAYVVTVGVPFVVGALYLLRRYLLSTELR